MSFDANIQYVGCVFVIFVVVVFREILMEVTAKNSDNTPVACEILDYVSCVVTFNDLFSLYKGLRQINIFSSNEWESNQYGGFEAIKQYQNHNATKMSDLRLGYGVNYRKPNLKNQRRKHKNNKNNYDSDLFDIFGPLYHITHRIDCLDSDLENNDSMTIIDNFRFAAIYVAISHPQHQNIKLICKIILTLEGCAKLLAEKHLVIDLYSKLFPNCQQSILDKEKMFEIKNNPQLENVYDIKYKKHKRLRKLCADNLFAF